MLHIVLGVVKTSDTDGVRMLRYLLHRYGVYSDYRFEYCYVDQPPSKVLDRKSLVEEARRSLESIWLTTPGVVVGLGWMPCEVLTGKGKTKLKQYVGTKWTYVGNIARTAWISYDPTGTLYDPAIVVDIAAVIVAAGKEAGLSMKVDTNNESLIQMDNIWKRYL